MSWLDWYKTIGEEENPDILKQKHKDKFSILIKKALECVDLSTLDDEEGEFTNDWKAYLQFYLKEKIEEDKPYKKQETNSSLISLRISL